MHTKNLLVLKKTILVLAVCWTILIAFLCLITFSKLPSLGVSGADKYVHFTFHFIFTLLWGYYSWLSQNKTELKKIITIVFISILFGILIEFMQEVFTVTRRADVLDVLANLAGATAAFLVFSFIYKKKSKSKSVFK